MALYIDSAGVSRPEQVRYRHAAHQGRQVLQGAVTARWRARSTLKFHRSVSSEAMVGAPDEAMSAAAGGDRRQVPRRLLQGPLLRQRQGRRRLLHAGSTLSIGEGAPYAASTLSAGGVCGALFDVLWQGARLGPRQGGRRAGLRQARVLPPDPRVTPRAGRAPCGRVLRGRVDGSSPTRAKDYRAVDGAARACTASEGKF